MPTRSLTHAFAALALTLGAGLAVRAQSADDAIPAKPKHHAAAPGVKHRKPMKHVPDSQKVDLNSASKAELMKLKGVDAACADRIIKGRPYYTKAKLLLENIMDKAVYDHNKYKMAAKQDPKRFPPPPAPRKK